MKLTAVQADMLRVLRDAGGQVARARLCAPDRNLGTRLAGKTPPLARWTSRYASDPTCALEITEAGRAALGEHEGTLLTSEEVRS